MSGGSFNYLCRKDSSDFVGYLGDLKEMAEFLAALSDAEDVAAETMCMIEELKAAGLRAQVHIERLKAVWRAVEWWQSSDGGEHQVREAIAVYRGVTPEGGT